MRQQELEQWLVASLDDFKLSHSEVLELRDILPRLASDDIAFARNKAFQLAREPVSAGGDSAVAILLWLEKLTKAIDNFRQAENSSIAEAHFSPGENCRRQLLDLLVGVRESIDISVFTISDDRLADAIIATHQRKVDVRIITDNDKALDQGSDVYRLAEHGVPVRMDSSANHMHHKFAVIDKKVLVNGSFNWTRSATDFNQENILVTDEPKLVSAYLAEFESLWREFE